MIFCGFSEGKIAAYVSHRHFSNGIADIGILIHPKHRRKGYGLTMVNHDTRRCIENNKIPLYTVCRDNTGSLSLINKPGYTPLVTAYRFSPAD